MITDAQAKFAESQDLAQAAGSYYCTYCINLGSTVGDPGNGKPKYVTIAVVEGFTSDGAATVQFILVDEANTTIDGGSVEIVKSRAYAYTDLVLGKVISIPIPVGVITQQYLGLKVVIGVAATTAGKIDAFITDQPVNNP